jgi:hypothetical protein
MVRRTCPPQLSAGNVAGAADGDPGEQTVGRVPDVFKRVTGEPRRCFFLSTVAGWGVVRLWQFLELLRMWLLLKRLRRRMLPGP